MSVEGRYDDKVSDMLLLLQ